MRLFLSAAIAASLTLPAYAQTRPDQQRFRALYKELIETNTTLSAGDCTLAAQKMAAHLKAAGYPDADLHLFTAPGHPKEGGLVAILHGTEPAAKAILLLGHLDVVEAKREDWTRDPFTLIEENGYFYGRGSIDMKAQVAVWVDTLVRLKEEGFRPPRSIKMALTCGEETSTAFNGAGWLAVHERDLIDADFALNEGGGGRLDENARPLVMAVQAAEKFPQNYQLEVTNPGGHSSRPVPNNAIYHLAAGLVKISTYQFPFQASEITRAYFGKMGPQVGGAMGAAMTVFSRGDMTAAKILAADPSYNAVLHTTCIPTLLSAGHANNALPQRADANINCRIFPGTSVEEVRAKLQELVADPEIKVTASDKRSEVPKGPQPLTPKVFRPVELLTARMWPGVPVVPFMSAGATDGAFLTPAGIPTYGVSGMFGDPDGNGAHGLNERLRVKSVYDGRDFLYQAVKIYAQAK
ncbi:MAG TPA: M20/M25/M40 family metallo-hydrolase [Rhizomicrobium sp.]|jgi:acetylornithine deacetylase/succinyl-diaminopimelate desuccinylase-like protein|nr:M20/M25/M40 family metallo-hydrolase [Rhizomicrobium sp.]